ncbi:RNA polymerase subunit sigma-24 [bacterium (candidate division B38) B3_B38]|nr:MAG: RNA polymerase subunit sigma-24 [bacterium (candidate division B38) B3_B38]
MKMNEDPLPWVSLMSAEELYIGREGSLSASGSLTEAHSGKGEGMLPDDNRERMSQIVFRCKQGEREALGTLYKMYKQRIYNIAYRMTSNHADSEEIVQEVFLKVYQKIGSFRGDSSFTCWIYRIAVNQSHSHWRGKGRRGGNKLVPLSEKENLLQQGKDGKRALFHSFIQQAIASLPMSCRTVFVLHDIEGFTHQEIAALKGCSVGASKSLLAKARLKMRRYLQPHMSLMG